MGGDPKGTMLDYDHRMRVWEGNRPVMAAHIQAMSTYATIAINALILANSAAAGAVLALLGALWSSTDRALVLPAAITSLKIFGAGIFMAIITSAGAYLCQLAYGVGDSEDTADPYLHERVERWYKIGRTLRAVCIATAVLAMTSFAAGAWYGVTSLEAFRAISSEQTLKRTEQPVERSLESQSVSPKHD